MSVFDSTLEIRRGSRFSGFDDAKYLDACGVFLRALRF